MKRTLGFAFALWAILLLAVLPSHQFAEGTIPIAADTTGTDTAQTVKPDYYKGVDVKIVYTFENEKPTWYRNVCCQLIRKEGKVSEIKIFLKTCTEDIRVIQGFVKYEIRDHATKKLIARGP
jgi:hypothetical protein